MRSSARHRRAAPGPWRGLHTTLGLRMISGVIIRPEAPQDHAAIHHLARDAFAPMLFADGRVLLGHPAVHNATGFVSGGRLTFGSLNTDYMMYHGLTGEITFVDALQADHRP